MKKKISLLVLCGIVLIGICGCGNEIKKEEQQTNNNSIGNYKYKTTIKCDVLDNVKKIYSIGLEYLIITVDNQIYYLSIDQLYSNDMNCKKIDNIEFLMIYRDNIVDKNGYVYHYSYDNKTFSNSNEIIENFKFLKNKNIVEIEQTGESPYYLLSNDGIIYSGNDGISGNFNKIKEIDNETIKNFYIVLEKIKYILTDKSLLTSEKTIINEEECNKYADIECQYIYKWVKDEKVSKQIKDFVGITPWMLIKKNGEVFIDEKIQRERQGG